jgi:hypothetical protein
MPRWVAVPIIVALLVAGVGSIPAAAADHEAHDNLARTQREAHRLVRLVVLPDGSIEMTHGSGMRMPRFTPWFFRAGQHWQVPAALQAARQWLKDHPPAGLDFMRSEGDGSTYERHYSDPGRSEAWLGRAHMTVTIAAAGDGTTDWTIAATVRPLSDGASRDSNDGYPFAVRPVDGCPSHERGISHVANGVAGSSGHFIPAGRVTAAVVCRYAGDRRLRRGRPKERLGLLASRRLGMSAAERLATLARGVSVHVISSYPPRGGIPPDYSAATLALHYASGRDVDLRLSREDLGAVLSNGTISEVSWLYGPGLFRFERALDRAARR